MRLLDSIMDSMDMSLHKLQEIVKAPALAVCPEHLLREASLRISSRASLAALSGRPLLHPPHVIGKLRGEATLPPSHNQKADPRRHSQWKRHQARGP